MKKFSYVIFRKAFLRHVQQLYPFLLAFYLVMFELSFFVPSFTQFIFWPAFHVIFIFSSLVFCFVFFRKKQNIKYFKPAIKTSKRLIPHLPRISAAIALVFLTACPLFLWLHKETAAEESAVYAYYFLVLTVILQIIPFGDKPMKKDPLCKKRPYEA